MPRKGVRIRRGDEPLCVPEDVGRKVKEWAKDIGKGKHQVTQRDGVGDGKRMKQLSEFSLRSAKSLSSYRLPERKGSVRPNQSYHDSMSGSSPLFIPRHVLSDVRV